MTLLLAFAALHEPSLDDVHSVGHDTGAVTDERPTDAVRTRVAGGDGADRSLGRLESVHQFVEDALLFP